jgi:hypothetical protein
VTDSLSLDLSSLGPTLDIPTAARLLGCGRSLAYELAKRDQFPCRVLRLGRRYVVPTVDLLRALGLPTDLPDTDPPPAAPRSAARQASAGAAAAHP